MSNNALELEWDEQIIDPVGPHLETNRWLDNVIPAEPRRRRVPECEEIEFLGERVTWVRDGGRPFPQGIVELFEQIAGFERLASGWDGYGGKALRRKAVAPALRLIFAGHERGYLPRVHPLSDGGIGVTWGRDEHELDVQVAANGAVEALLLDGEDEIELPPGSDVTDALSLVRKFFGSR